MPYVIKRGHKLILELHHIQTIIDPDKLRQRSVSNVLAERCNAFLIPRGFGGAYKLGILRSYLIPFEWMETISELVSEGLTKAAPLVAVVGSGGILLDSNIGNVLGSSLCNIGVPGAIVVFLVAAMIKTAQGSSMVTMVTAPTILLPLLRTLGVTPTLATLLVSAGGMVEVNINDSFSWVVRGASHMTINQGIRGVTMMSVIQGITALVLLLAIRTGYPAL